MRHLDRRMADDLEQFLVIPHIIFTRRNIQITHQDGALWFFCGKNIAQLGEVIKFLSKFFVLRAIRHIAASGHIVVVDGDPIGQTARHMPGVAQLGQIQTPCVFQRKFR